MKLQYAWKYTKVLINLIIDCLDEIDWLSSNCDYLTVISGIYKDQPMMLQSQQQHSVFVSASRSTKFRLVAKNGLRLRSHSSFWSMSKWLYASVTVILCRSFLLSRHRCKKSNADLFIWARFWKSDQFKEIGVLADKFKTWDTNTKILLKPWWSITKVDSSELKQLRS